MMEVSADPTVKGVTVLAVPAGLVVEGVMAPAVSGCDDLMIAHE